MIFVVMEEASNWHKVAQILLFLQSCLSAAHLYTTGLAIEIVNTVLFLPSLLSSLSAAV